MKTFSLWTVLTLWLALMPAQAAQFEGRLHYQRAQTPGEPDNVICAVKGDKIRVEVIRERVNTFITDTAKKETTVIMEDDMAFLVMTSLQPFEDLKLEKTAETDTILGHKTQKYTLSSDEGETELWLAEGFGRYTGFGEGFEQPPKPVPNVDLPEAPVPKAWEYALAGQPLFPLRVVTRDGANRESYRLEIRAITPDPLSEKLFVPSTNYKKLDTWPER
jgi:hypothetical protein